MHQLTTCSSAFRRAFPHEYASTEELLAMTFVHGPEGASFLDEKPARLRFFLGYTDEFAPRDGSERLKVLCTVRVAMSFADLRCSSRSWDSCGEIIMKSFASWISTTSFEGRNLEGALIISVCQLVRSV